MPLGFKIKQNYAVFVGHNRGANDCAFVGVAPDLTIGEIRAILSRPINTNAYVELSKAPKEYNSEQSCNGAFHSVICFGI